MKKFYFSLILLCLGYLTPGAFAQTTTYSTPGAYVYTVGTGVTSLSITVNGAQGGTYSTGTGGLGGRVQATYACTPGQLLYVYVGAVGGAGSGGAGGSSSGGGENGGNGGSSGGGAGGGAASDVRTSIAGGATSTGSLASRFLVGGGGGGGNWSCSARWPGGQGGYPTGGGGTGSCTSGTTGGTQTSGGVAGPTYSSNTGAPGVFGNGGNGVYWGGGGGGGWYGGGGAAETSGGGGSSYAGAGTSSVTYTNGAQSSNGSVAITVLCNAPGTITGTLAVCAGATTTLSNAAGGGTWSSSNGSVATVSSTTGVVTGVSSGTATITYNVSSPCGGTPATAVVTVNAVAGAISGTATMCNGSGTTLSASPSGGTWSSSATGVATVNSTTGAVSSVSTGTSTIVYNLNNGCATSSLVVTVNTQPAAISGSSATLCGGSGSTSTTLTNSTSGGTWTSSNSSMATVNSSGVVTGVASGAPTITYTMPGNCFVTKPMSVNAVAPITGPSSVCLSSTINLSDATFGGSWVSNNSSVASVNSSGVVTGVSIGATIISYNVGSLGCSAITTVNVTNPPSTFTVTGGGSYCAGGIGVHIGLNNSNSGITYYLFNGTTLVTTATGPSGGGAIDFGLFTASGTYTVVANYGTACASTMSGSATVSVNSLPTAFSVGGGGSYCNGGTGVNITLSSSTIGVNYQLMLGGTTPVGSPQVGTSGMITFGPVTAAGTYTVIATNATTGCINNMSGSAIVTINPLPTALPLTGGGGFCLGGSGVTLCLCSGSTAGISYQLLLSGSPVGSPMTGTGGNLTFGPVTTGGPYTVQATNLTTGCINMMSGTATVTVNPLPTAYTVTGGGGYCLGGPGSPVNLAGSQIGVNYQLFLGSTPMGSPVAGTGVAISFGNQTTVGSYTVVATDAITGCINSMFGSVAITTNPLPTVYTVTGGGGYCAGGTGVNVGLSGSTVGTNYQLFWNGTLVGAASGTGSPLNFGLQLTAGIYTVVATNLSTGCSGNMSGSVAVSINPLPNIYGVSGGGAICAGAAGLPINLSNSDLGVNYQLYNGITPVGAAMAGTNSALVFPAQTAAGSYTVGAVNATTTCTSNMSGSAAIIVNPLPTIYATTGGGGYCAGGSGVHIGLAASNTGIDYQLMNSGGPVSGAMSGTGFSLDFGLITTANIYYVQATNATTLCTVNMSGSVAVSINLLPTAYTVTGGGNYCAGSGGLPIGVSNSTTNVYYQLYNGATPVGAAVAGTTGTPISFGMQTAAGTYTVVGTDVATGCSNAMSNPVTIVVDPLPGVFVITGGGNYCSGGAGVHVGLSGSAIGINYQLMNGVTAVGAAIPGTGGPLDFGLQTGSGSYTVVATDAGTSCMNTMTGSVTININPLPTLFSTTGGGNYCAGGSGLAIGLSGSSIGVSYQLLNGGLPSGAPMSGTGIALSFGMRTAAGNYTIVGTNTTTGCLATMNSSATIVMNSLPAAFTVTGGGSYCLGGLGVSVGLNNSNTGTNYQLYNGVVAVGAPMPGSTGSALDFGMQSAVGIYTVKATDISTGCTGNMTGSASVGTYPLPVVYNITGGGSYCSGGTGVNIGVSGSNVGITYQLWSGGFPVSSPVAGTGTAISFGLQTVAGSYTVEATNTTTTCTKTMNGTATVVVSPLPTAYTVTGGGNYCAGGTGVVIGLSGSDAGTNYQLMNGITPMGAPKPGTGLAISFGLQTASGSYTVVATATSTTCVNTMTGSVNVNIDPLPTAYNVTGGGNYCSGGAGVSIGLSFSDPGISYQLMRGTTMVGSPQTGIAAALDFGMQTVAGTYTVLATDLATGCTKTMTGTATVVINLLPTTYIVGGGGNYCSGGTGLHITLTGSNTGISYQLKIDGSNTGSPLAGTGMALDFGLQTAGGVYTIEATNNTTSCTNMMTGSATIVVNPLPTVYPISSTSSTYCAGGGGVNIWTNSSDIGVNYQLYVGSTMVGLPKPGTGSSVNFGFLFTPGTYTVVGTNATTGCTNLMASSVFIVVNPLPTVYTVTGGGGYCNGGAGVNVGLSGSNTGIAYQLMLGTLPVGSPVMGTGSPLSFGMQTLAGAYTVVATNVATTCVNNMSGSATVVMNSLPVAFTVTGGGNYCAGGAGMSVMLTGSVSGINYQLYRGGTTIVGSPVAGTGGVLNFGPQTGAGAYTVVATNPATGCSNNMTGSATVNINPAPTAYSVVGGGNYCPGGTGVHVGVSNSDPGVNYQLMLGSGTVGSPVAGVGGAIDFGLQTATGSYTVVATNLGTGCIGSMSGSASIGINPLPTAYSVIGGGNYCAGGAGVHVGLSNSATGINYTLYAGSLPVSTIPGTGSPIDFGLQTAAGTYTVLAVNAATTCQILMTGSVTVVISPVVTPSVSIGSSGGTTVCEGNFITYTAMPTNGGGSPTYQWMVNGSPSAVGVSYSYVPSNGDVVSVIMTSSIACATPSSVTAAVTMTVDPNQMPAVAIAANPGTSVCQGTSVTYSATPSYGGTPTYTWFINGSSMGSSPSYTYIPANGDEVYVMMASTYHCRLANTANSSKINMQVDVPVLPIVSITANPGLYVPSGQAVTFTCSVVNGGSTPAYQWYVNGVAVAGATTPVFSTSTLADNDSVTCQVQSSSACAGLEGFNSVRVHVSRVGVQNINTAASDIRLMPNPSKGIFTVKGTLAADEEVAIEVTNMLGQVIYTANAQVRNGELNERIELRNIANGMYILNLRSGTEQKVFHVVVEQ